jgi:hypothetical protein
MMNLDAERDMSVITPNSIRSRQETLRQDQTIAINEQKSAIQ